MVRMEKYRAVSRTQNQPTMRAMKAVTTGAMTNDR